ncbi:MAG: BNR repeat-containing protein [Bacteroidetes bacterium]|nr:BNR repeat-containing protein [Bacteroidota bacterium]
MRFLSTIFSVLVMQSLSAQTIQSVKIIPVDTGWAGNAVNTVIFRKNAICTYHQTQFVAYYNSKGNVVLAKRKLSSTHWSITETPYTGNIKDAHRSISIIADGKGYLHVSWNHHGNILHYAKSIAPESLVLTKELPMTGSAETNVTYPEFYTLPNGGLLFLYRDGQSGKGNLVINRYNINIQQWTQLHQNLIDGEGKRNAYWQAFVDVKGTIHISWVWRESPDVASNHDLCYARSTDGGITWTNSKNEVYQLPINATTAEYVCRIPQHSELMNQTSMCADDAGHPFIATYWKEQGDSIPQYHIVYKTGGSWQVLNTAFRKTPFTLSGMGTRRIPISRPQLVSYAVKGQTAVILLFRDEERGSKVSAAVCDNIKTNHWEIKDLSPNKAGSWEPMYDTELWKQKKQLHLLVQYTEQGDAETTTSTAPQPVQVMECTLRPQRGNRQK